MKKTNWLYIFAFALLANCTGNTEKQTDQPKSDTTEQKKEQAVQPKEPKEAVQTVISLAQLVLDTLIESPTLLKETKSGNLKKIWNYDERLYLASSQSKKFIVTKEINPCCPCSSTETACCMCLIDTNFAAVSEMEANATLDGVDMKNAPSIPGVDIFSVPTGTLGKHTLKISGKSIPAVTYTVTLENGTIRFN